MTEKSPPGAGQLKDPAMCDEVCQALTEMNSQGKDFANAAGTLEPLQA